MKVTHSKTVITVDEKEYEIIKAFCESIMEIYDADEIYESMVDILDCIANGGRTFDSFNIELE